MKWSEIMDEDVMRLGDNLMARADMLRQQGVHVYPPRDQVYRALALTPPDKLKVCIIGQDPYHTAGAANGLAFSINPGRYLQPSLQNIFTELCADVKCPMPSSGDLTPWAERGVLLLNTSLTVQEGQPASHADWGWQDLTKHVFRLAVELPQPVVFILWGAHARKFAKDVDWYKHRDKFVIQSAHPSPLSATRGFFGSRPFTAANTYLAQMGIEPVDWSLP